MPTADFDHRHFEVGNNAGDEQLLVKFFIKARENKTKSLKEGRSIFEDVEYVDIRVAGSRNGHVCRAARDGDKRRFPKHYEAFKQRTEMPVEGTPLVEWAIVTRSQAEELAFFNVKTVEQLAAMSDTQAQKFMGMHSLRRKAKDWLTEAKENAPALKLAEELRVRDEQFAELQAKFDKLSEMMESVSLQKNTAEPVVVAAAAPEIETVTATTTAEKKPATRRRRVKK